MKAFFLFAVAAAAIAGVWFLQAPIPQDDSYHRFADARTLFGIPHFYNITSNALLLVVALAGLFTSYRLDASHNHFHLRREFGLLFSAALLIALGSAWYHLQPSTAALVWDRLPMAVVFTTMLALVIAIYISRPLGKLLLWPLLFAGIGSVLYWYKTEQLGAGDLRFYALTQFLPVVLALLILILYHRAGKPNLLLGLTLFMYILAKAGEHFDSLIYHYTAIISGHSLKHLFAGLALLMWLLMLRRRHV